MIHALIVIKVEIKAQDPEQIKAAMLDNLRIIFPEEIVHVQAITTPL